MNRKRHLDKLKQEEERLDKLTTLKEAIDIRGQKVLKEEMKTLMVRSVDGLQNEIQSLTATIGRTKERLERRAIEVPKESMAEELDPNVVKSWVTTLKDQRHRLQEQRASRKQRKSDLGKRRSYASQQRMKILTQLASGKTGKKVNKEDTFGRNDEDWLVYREIVS